MTRDLDNPLEIALGVVSRQGLGIWMSFMTWTVDSPLDCQ